MSFDNTQPVATDSPSIFPGKNQINMTRLQTILGDDHQFNLSPLSNDGYHKVVHYITQSGTFGDNTPAPVTGTGIDYVKSVTTTGTGGSTTEQFMWHQGTGGVAANEACLSICPTRAACVFDGTSVSTGAVTPKWAFNCSINKNSTGVYTITFTNTLPSANYTVNLCAARSSGANLICGQIFPGAYGTSNTTTTLKVYFTNSSDQVTDGTYISIEVKGG